MGCRCRAEKARSRSAVMSASWLRCIIWAWFVVCFPYLGCASLSEPLTMFTAANAQIPGCPTTCGNLTIAYPFGIGRACALSDDYAIKCITENGTTFAQHVNNYTVILDFAETQLTTTFTPLARSCNSKGEEIEGANKWGELHVAGKPYAISSTDNAFIVIGCHHYGLIRANTKTGRKVTSCVALCTEQQDLYDGTCSGVGCCEASLPKGLQDLTSILEKIIYNATVSSGKCGYSLLSKRSDQTLRWAIDLEDPDFYSKVRRLPGVLDWFIANATCSEARKNAATYVCQRHTTCTDLDQELDVYRYRCKCLPGFEGNPYLTAARIKCGTKNGTACTPKTLNLAVPLGITTMPQFQNTRHSPIAKRRREVVERAINFKRNGRLLLKQKMSSNEGMIENTRLYTAVELDKATNHFNDDRILGQGGQGTVYKGMLSDGNIVAIKKSKKDGAINEIVILSQINHRNIMKLLGSCRKLIKGAKVLRPILEGKSLVSWFLSAMENSNLDDILATRIAKEGNKDDINATANLAKRCLNMGGKHKPSMRQVLVELEMISKHHNVHDVDDQKTTPPHEVTSKDITFSPSDRILPPYVDEDYSFPSNWSTNSQIQSDSIERFT